MGCEHVMEKGGVRKGNLEGVVANTKRRTPKFPGLGQAKPKLPNCNRPLVCCNFGARCGLRWTFAGQRFFALGDLGLKAPPKPQLNSVEFGGNRVGRVLLIAG